MKDMFFLKECLADALFVLMQDQPYESITITDITKKANISRATYYRHFSNKEELIAFKFQLLFKQLDEYISANKITNAYDIALHFFYFIQQNRFFVTTIRDAHLSHITQRFFVQYLKEASVTLYDEYKNTGISYFIIGLVNTWMDHDFKETPEQLCKMMQDILHDITY